MAPGHREHRRVVAVGDVRKLRALLLAAAANRSATRVASLPANRVTVRS